MLSRRHATVGARGAGTTGTPEALFCAGTYTGDDGAGS